MNELSINKNRTLLPSEDYNLLREQGIALIQKLSGAVWTDFNEHDPGVSILETLSYALTDLAYRTNKDMTTILAESDYSLANKSFYSALDILTSHPVSELDIRKLLIDGLPDVRNVWVAPADGMEQRFKANVAAGILEIAANNSGATDPNVFKTLNGIYKIILEPKRGKASTTSQKNALRAAAKAKLMEHRNLCEDFYDLEIKVPTFINVSVYGDIQLKKEADPETVLANIYHRLERLISPQIPFRSLDDLQRKGKLTEEIFEGPILQNGFIDSDELLQVQPVEYLYTSDMINVIMDIEGVEEVNMESFILQKSGVPNTDKWKLKLRQGSNLIDSVPVLNIDTSNASKFKFLKGNVTISDSDIDPVVVKQKFENLLKAEETLSEINDLNFPQGELESLAEYSAVQNELPNTYGTNRNGLPSTVSMKRKVQALQLKGYLTFFEQLFANYLNQLAETKELYSWKSNTTQTYFTNTLKDLLKDDSLVLDAQILDDNVKLNELIENPEGFRERKNRFLEHLLARFNEEMVEYSIMMFSIMNTETAETKLILDRISFLDQYPILSAERGKGFNYKLLKNNETEADVWDTDNVPGYQKRVARLLGIENYNRRHLITVDETDPLNPIYTAQEGLHVIEHIMLRPLPAEDGLDSDLLDVEIGPTEENTCGYNKNPYSFRMTVFLPAQAGRFVQYNFRKYAEQLLRLECPAHIALDIRWIESSALLNFENCYKDWLTALALSTDLQVSRNCVITGLNNILDYYSANYFVPLPKNEDAYTDGFVLAQLNQGFSPIVRAEIIRQVPENNSKYTAYDNRYVYGTTTLRSFPITGITMITDPNDPNIGNIVVEDAEAIKAGTDGNGTVSVPGVGGAGKWHLDIETENENGDVVQHHIVIEINDDEEAIYKINTKPTNQINEDTYTSPGYVLAELDTTGNNRPEKKVASAIIINNNLVDYYTNNGGIPANVKNAIGIVTSAGVVHDIFGGNITNLSGIDTQNVGAVVVLNTPANIKNFRKVSGSSLYTPFSHQITLTIQTTDELGGITTNIVQIEILADEEASYINIVPAKSLYEYKANDVLATLFDQNGLIKTRTLASGVIPPGTTLMDVLGQKGNIVITNLALFRSGVLTALQTPNPSTLSSGCVYQAPSVLESVTYSITVDTVDSTGGESFGVPLSITFNRDTPAIYFADTTGSIGRKAGVAGQMTSDITHLIIYADEYADGDVFATVTDANGTITNAVACNLMPGLVLDPVTGKLTVNPPQDTGVVLGNAGNQGGADSTVAGKA